MVDGCTGFHLVVRGDICADIAASAGTWLTDFVSWNPRVGSDCSGPLVGLLRLYHDRVRLVLVIIYIFHYNYYRNDHRDHDIDIDREWSGNPNSLRVWHHN
jgi:hypothetical protein